jgi:hypothetical protein
MTLIVTPTSTTDAYGPLLGADTARDAIKATLQLWTPSYIAAISAARGLPASGAGSMKPVQDWTIRPEYRTLPVSSSPAILVTCPGTVKGKAPTIHGDGNIRADWLTEVSIVVFGDDWEPTADLTTRYATAVRAAILQHRSLNGVALNTVWLGEQYAEVEHSSTRTLGVAVIHFAVTLDAVMNVQAGPITPPIAPAIAYPLPDNPRVKTKGATATVTNTRPTRSVP